MKGRDWAQECPLWGAYDEPMAMALTLSVEVESPEEARGRVVNCLDRERGRLKAHGAPDPLIERYESPAVALLDEAGHRTYPRGWNSISGERFGHEALGERFFDTLDALMSDPEAPISLLATYARALRLGVCGRYALGGRGELEARVDALLALIARRAPDGGLSPGPWLASRPSEESILLPAPLVMLLWILVVVPWGLFMLTALSRDLALIDMGPWVRP